MNHTRRAALVASIAAILAMTCVPGHAQTRKITLGFSQVGAESEWRSANTLSIKSAAAQAGINLKFSDAHQKQENQIMAIRSFIAQKVDVIAFSPVVVSGWETVLKEAKAARIPVVLTDRMVEVKDKSLFVSTITADFAEQGRRSARWMIEHFKNAKGEVNIVELQGTVGSKPAIDRKKGFEEIIRAHPKFRIIRSQSGDFTRAKGKEVMEAFLKAEGNKISVLYAHNDDMALGAIQAIEEAGLRPANDVVIISIDAVRGAFEAMMAGKLNVSVECNPLLGPQLMDIVQKVVAGQSVPAQIIIKDDIFPAEIAAKVFPTRKY